MVLSSIQLEAFFTLGQAGNFTRAAERLHVTQSALSQRILNLESELETTLFIRERQGVRLTQEGLELLRYCQAKNGLEAEFLSRLQSKSPKTLMGRIRLGGFSSVLHSLLVPSLASLLKEQEGVRLYCLAREVYELPHLLQQGEVDYIALDYKWEREGIVSLLLGHEQNVLVERKGYRGPEVYIDHDEKDEMTAKYFRQYKKKWSGQRHFLDDIHGLVEGVRNGVGRAILPRHLIDSDSAFKIIDPERVLQIPVYLHFYEQPYYSKLHEAALDALRSVKF